MNARGLATGLIYGAGVMSILASGGPAPVSKIPPDPISLIKKSPDSQCTCTNSVGLYIKNSDSKSRVVNYYWKKKDTIGNSTTTGSDKKTAAPNSDTFLSCSIESGPLGCTTEWSYELGSHTVTNSSKALVGFGSGEKEQTLEICKALCGSGDPSCFAMGPAFIKISAPLAKLYFKAVGNNEALIQKQAILKEYGLEGQQDLCERSDVMLSDKGTQVENTTATDKACEIKALDAFKALGPLVSNTDMQDLDNLTLWVRPIVRAEVVKALTAMGKTDMVTFPRNNFGLNLQFTGPNGDAATAAYGSFILGMQQVGNTLVIQTANGCMSSQLSGP